MKIKVAFAALSVAFCVAVFAAAVTTKKFIDRHEAQQHTLTSGRPAV